MERGLKKKEEKGDGGGGGGGEAESLKEGIIRWLLDYYTFVKKLKRPLLLQC